MLAHDVALGLFVFGGAAAAIDEALAPFAWWLRVVTLAVVARLVIVAALAPFTWWLDVVHTKRWGRGPRHGRWIRGYVIDGLVSTAVVTAGVVVFAASIRAFPTAWPMITALGLAALVGLVAAAQPLLVDPLFHRFSKLEDGPLRSDVLALAHRAGTPLRDVVVMATGGGARANAYVTGIGPTQELVVFDTLLAYPRSEVLSVVAHELQHRRRGHHLKLTLLRMATAAASAAIISWCLDVPWLLRAAHASSPADPRVVPLVLLLAFVLERVGAVLIAVPWRRWEREADRAALDLTSSPEDMERVIRRIALANLSDLTPPRAIYLLTFTHPTAIERVRAARRWAPGSPVDRARPTGDRRAA